MSRIPLKLLIVEDSQADAELLLRELRRGGYDPEFERVENAEQLRVALDRTQWDAALVDHALPNFDAPSALAIWRERGIDQPFIIVSDVIPMDTAVTMMKAGAHDFVMKFDLTRLVPAIRRELREAEIRRVCREEYSHIQKANQELTAMVGELKKELEQFKSRSMVVPEPNSSKQANPAASARHA